MAHKERRAQGTEEAVDDTVQHGMSLFNMVMKEYTLLEIERRSWDTRMSAIVDRVKSFYTSEYPEEIDRRAIADFRVGVIASVSSTQNKLIDYFSDTVNRELARLPRLSMVPAYTLLFTSIRARRNPENHDFIDMLMATAALHISDPDVKKEVQARFDVDASPALVPPGGALMRSEKGQNKLRQTS